MHTACSGLVQPWEGGRNHGRSRKSIQAEQLISLQTSPSSYLGNKHTHSIQYCPSLRSHLRHCVALKSVVISALLRAHLTVPFEALQPFRLDLVAQSLEATRLGFTHVAVIPDNKRQKQAESRSTAFTMRGPQPGAFRRAPQHHTAVCRAFLNNHQCLRHVGLGKAGEVAGARWGTSTPGKVMGLRLREVLGFFEGGGRQLCGRKRQWGLPLGILNRLCVKGRALHQPLEHASVKAGRVAMVRQCCNCPCYA